MTFEESLSSTDSGNALRITEMVMTTKVYLDRQPCNHEWAIVFLASMRGLLRNIATGTMSLAEWQRDLDNATGVLEQLHDEEQKKEIVH